MTSARHAVARKVIATVDDLEQIAADDHADVAALHGWRRELFGEAALALKHGRLALAIEKGRVARGDRNLRKVRLPTSILIAPQLANITRNSCVPRALSA